MLYNVLGAGALEPLRKEASRMSKCLRLLWISVMAISLTVLPLFGTSPTAVSAEPLSPHTPMSNDGKIFVPTKKYTKDSIVKKNEGYSPAYQGTGKLKTEKSEFSAQGVQPVKTSGMIGINSVIGTDQRTRVSPATSFPYRAIVHIESDIGGCTGWLIGPNTVATAGHCIYNPGSRKWASYATVTPGRDGSSKPYGSANAVRLFAPSGWVNNGDTNYDYGAIKLDSDIGYSTGWLGYRWTSGNLNGTPETISGYPGDKPYGTQWQHKDQIRQSYTYKLHYANDTYGGQSGSPVYEDYNSACGGPCSIAVHTNGVYGGNPYNRGTRITQEVYNNFQAWTAN